MKSRPVFKWVVAGVLAGYFIIHPMFMSVGHLMHQENIYTQHTLRNIILASFSVNMAPWALSFVFIFGFIGYLYGKVLLNGALLKSAKMELEDKVKKRTKALLHANQVLWAEILQRKKAEKELIEQIGLAELSAEIGAALVRHENLTAQLQHCSECIVKHLDAAFARIWIFNKDRNVLQLKASAGLYTHTDGYHSVKKMGELKIGIIAEQKKPHLTNTVIGDPMISDQEWARQEGIVSFAGYPLVLSDKVVGVMAMFSKKPLNETVLHALKSISDSVALGIEKKKQKIRSIFWHIMTI